MEVKIQLAIAMRLDGRDWIARCPGIDVATQARTKRQALAGIGEGVELWFESCIDRNVLSEALSEAGFKTIGPGEKVPAGAPNLVATMPALKSGPESHAAESPTFGFELRRRNGQSFLEGFIPEMLVRSGPYNHASVQVA